MANITNAIPEIIPYFKSLTLLFQFFWIFWIITGPILLLTTTVIADTQTYEPPPEKGDVYVIINKTKFKKIVKLSVKWGKWYKSEKIDLSNHDGLVLHLNHFDNDSFPLTVITEGKIVNNYPIQSVNPPEEWNNKRYRKEWW